MTAIMILSLAVCAFVVGVAYGAGGTWFVMQRIEDADDNEA